MTMIPSSVASSRIGWNIAYSESGPCAGGTMTVLTLGRLSACRAMVAWLLVLVVFPVVVAGDRRQRHSRAF